MTLIFLLLFIEANVEAKQVPRDKNVTLPQFYSKLGLNPFSFEKMVQFFKLVFKYFNKLKASVTITLK